MILEYNYAVRSSLSGDVINETLTKAEAKAIIKQFEKLDKKDGTYEEGFYEIYDLKKEEII